MREHAARAERAAPAVAAARRPGRPVAGCEGVWHRYGAEAPWVLRDLTCRLEPGGVVALLGRNGAGKTTLVNLLVGALRPTRGIVRHVPRVGLVSQRPVLDGDLTVAESVRLVAMVTGASRAQIDELLGALHLDAHRNRRVGTLSGGTQRRLDVALAFLGDPAMILLDEPTVGLDPQSRAAFWDWFRRRGRDRAVLFTTQELAEVADVADVVWLLHDGTLRVVGADDLDARPWRVVTQAGAERTHSDVASFAEALELARRLERDVPGAVTEVRRVSLTELFLAATGTAPEADDAGVSARLERRWAR
jgi:ABC-2 type transport system ATP-binding protein